MVLIARRFETGMNHSRLILGKLAAPQQAAGWALPVGQRHGCRRLPGISPRLPRLIVYPTSPTRNWIAANFPKRPRLVLTLHVAVAVSVGQAGTATCFPMPLQECRDASALPRPPCFRRRTGGLQCTSRGDAPGHQGSLPDDRLSGRHGKARYHVEHPVAPAELRARPAAIPALGDGSAERVDRNAVGR